MSTAIKIKLTIVATIAAFAVVGLEPNLFLVTAALYFGFIYGLRKEKHD